PGAGREQIVDAAVSAPLPAFADQQRAAGSGFRVGQQVFHNKFGEGTVTALEGSGADAKAQVKFKRHGEKWLALAVAKLQAVE
ncbi:DNA helicase II, partial [Burkholderia sp. Ac-20353]|nr:DNA helicase II [Burkholderia sp. Ac-20353]